MTRWRADRVVAAVISFLSRRKLMAARLKSAHQHRLLFCSVMIAAVLWKQALIQLYPSSTVSGTVSLNQCSQEPLPAGAVCAIAISVKGLQSGPYRIDMLMRHSARSRLVTASLSGQIRVTEDAADKFLSDIEAIPDEIDFGDANTSQPVIKGIVLRNTTSQVVDINSIYIDAAEQSGYSLRTDCDRLESGQACIVTVKWSPVLKGQASGVLLVNHSGPTSVASVNLDGDYNPDSTEEAKIFPETVPGKGLVVSSQSEIDFGSDINSLSTITVSLVNVGDAPVTLKDIRMSGKDTGLNVANNGCMPDMVLEPVEACPLTVSGRLCAKAALLMISRFFMMARAAFWCCLCAARPIVLSVRITEPCVWPVVIPPPLPLMILIRMIS